MRPAIRVDDSRVVNHLVAEGHHTRRLHDPVAVAVDDAQHRTDDTARDAAIVEREVLRRVERSVAERSAIARCPPLLGRSRERGHAAVRRINNERRLPERPPREVIAERADVVLAAFHALLDLFDSSGERFVTQIEVAGEILGPLTRNPTGVIAAPYA